MHYICHIEKVYNGKGEKIMKSEKIEWYKNLTPYFPKDGGLTLKEFASIEAVLHLLLQQDENADVEKAYLLFAQYQTIGMERATNNDRQLQYARRSLGYFRAREFWLEQLKKYKDAGYDNARAFNFIILDKKVVARKKEEGYPYSYNNRLEEWKGFWTDWGDKKEDLPIAKEGRYVYYATPKNDDGTDGKITVDISAEYNVCGKDGIVPIYEPQKECICLEVQELLNCAKEMKTIFPKDYCFEILKSNIIKKVKGKEVLPTDCLTINQVQNIVGMVGAGKSTLIKVLAFWVNKNNKKMVVVLDTVSEVMHLWEYLDALGVNCTPLVGRKERLKYINQLANPEKTCLPEKISKYLTTACLIDGMNNSEDASLTYGAEPCYSLNKDQKSYICPYFDICPGARMMRECYEKNIVLTTVAGYAMTKVGKNRELFLNVVLEQFDIVIFDESDRCQKTLDQLFMPETSFNDYIKESADNCARHMKSSVKERENHPAQTRYAQLQLRSAIVMGCISAALKTDLGKWNRLKEGESFSALMLLQDMQQDEIYSLPQEIYEKIHSLMKTDEIEEDVLYRTLKLSCVSTDFSLFDASYKDWVKEEVNMRERKQSKKILAIQDARIKLILCLIYFDKFIRELNDAYALSHETSYGQNELFSFVQSRFKEQQRILPSAVCGNLFGLKRNSDGDIILFRQFAFGRSLMKDLPYLKLDEQGRPIGPHVIMLSGSSWAEGSYEYHINRPVNYILEADAEKRDFLEKTKFYESGFLERVSGARDEDKFKMLKMVVEKSTDLIIQEYNRNAGKILLIVNSYSQAETICSVLQKSLEREYCKAKVCYMVSDAKGDKIENSTIKRGEVSRFADSAYDILIAPALAIERGHNIVDETGHSAIGAVFFMVRPMSVPDDIQDKGSKLNGYIEAHFPRRNDESVWDYNLRVRQEATKRWSIVTGKANYGLSDLEEADQKDIVSTLFILILQIFGRLARVTDVSRPAAHVYFMDGAFRGVESKPNSFDCLKSLGEYLDDLMSREDCAAIAKTLYEPFYKAYKGGIQHG